MPYNGTFYLKKGTFSIKLGRPASYSNAKEV